jgi:hypothetical protein
MNTKLIKFILLISLSLVTACNDYPSTGDMDNFDQKTYCSNNHKYGHIIVLIDRTSKLTEAQYQEIKKVFFSKDSSALYKKYDKGYKFSYFLINGKKPAENNLIFSKCKVADSSFWSNDQDLAKYRTTFFSNLEKDALISIFKSDGSSDNSFIYETISWVAKSFETDFSSDQPYREIIVVSDLMQKSEKIDLYKTCKENKCLSLDELKSQNIKLSNFLDADSNKEDNKKIKVSFYILTTCDTNPSRDPKVLFNFWRDLLKKQGFDVADRPRVQQTENTKNTCEQARY